MGIVAFLFYEDKDLYTPEIRSADLELGSVMPDKTAGVVHLWIRNKLPFALSADSVKYTFFLDGQLLGRIIDPKRLVLKKLDSTQVTLHAVVYNEQLKEVIEKNRKNESDTVEVIVRTTFYFNSLLLDKLTRERKYYRPLLHIPTMKITRLEIDSINFQRLVIGEVVTIGNPNVFPLRGRNNHYQFFIEGRKVSDGFLPGELTLKSKRETEVKFPLQIYLKNVGNSIFELLEKGDQTKYNFILTFRTVSDDPRNNNKLIRFESHGTLHSLKSSGKEIRKFHLRDIKSKEPEHHKKEKHRPGGIRGSESQRAS